MEIKYEAVFGPQELFDGMMDDCEFASEEYGYMFANGVLYYCERYNEKAGWGLSCKSHLTFKPSAMRRIIRTPTWTVADQKAGKLPPVGITAVWVGFSDTTPPKKTKYPTSGTKIEIVAWTKTSDGKHDVAVFKWLHNDGVSQRYAASGEYDDFAPIESEAERQQREREEWCIKALSSCSILSGMKKYDLKRLGGYIEDIYDALLSGDLPVPGKDGK